MCTASDCNHSFLFQNGTRNIDKRKKALETEEMYVGTSSFPGVHSILLKLALCQCEQNAET